MKSTAEHSRNVGLDLLKALSMLMVILIHVVIHGGLLEATGDEKASTVFVLYTFSFCAVNVYGMISGYVGVKSRIHYTSLMMQHLRVVFYSVLITLAFYLLEPGSAGKKDVLYAAFPYLNRSYWYYTAYLPVALLAPYLNRMLLNLTRRQLISLSVLVLVLFSLCPSLLQRDMHSFNWGYSVTWLACLYILGGVVRLLALETKVRGKWMMLIYVFLMASVAILRLIKNDVQVYKSYLHPVFVLAAAALVIAFAHMKISGQRLQRAIVYVSILSFSAYLIHDHELVRIRLMRGSSAAFAAYPLVPMVLLVLLMTLGIYMVCIFTDIIRESIFRGLRLRRHVERLEKKLLGMVWFS